MSDSNKFYRQPQPNYQCGIEGNSQAACKHGPLMARCTYVEEGKERCVPVRTMQGWFRIVGIISTLFAAVIVCLVLPNWKVSSVLAPGPLSQAHAQLLSSSPAHSEAAILANDRCAACHPIALSPQEKELLVVTHTKNGVPAPVGLQSQLCLNCHQENMPTAREGNPHDLVGDDLVRLLDSNKSLPPTSLAKETTECSQCHREHRSDRNGLAEMSSHRCQACHRSQFESFSNGHPEFSNYPVPSDRKIAFDHQAHRELHFSKKNMEFDCRLCHVSEFPTNQSRDVFRTVSFEKACSSCHLESLSTASTDGIVILQLPSLDRGRLEASGIDIGNWPVGASQLMDGELSSLWRKLIEAEPGGVEALAKLPRSGRFADVDLHDAEQLNSLSKLTEIMRNAFLKIANEGQPRIKSVLTDAIRGNEASDGSGVSPASLSTDSSTDFPAFGTKGSTEEWSSAFAFGFPVDVIRLANERWFGASAVPTPQPNAEDPKQAGNAEKVSSHSGLVDSNLVIRQPKPIESLAPDASESLLDDTLSDQHNSLLESDSLLSGESLLDEGASLLDAPTADTEGVAGAAEGMSFKPLRGWEHMPFGGWMLDESRVAIVYIPKAHADRWVSRWVEWELMNGASQNEDRFRLSVVGQCLQCHSMNQGEVLHSVAARHRTPELGSVRQPVTDMQSLWRITGTSAQKKSLHKFAHSPHLTIASLSDCRSCHILADRATQGSETPSSWSGVSEFKNMTKMLCASCHQDGLAGDACTQCHNYHVHGFSKIEKPTNEMHSSASIETLREWTSKQLR